MRTLCGLILFIILFATTLSAQDSKKGDGQESITTEKVQFKALPFDLRDVRLLNGPLKTLLERNRAYLLSLDVDRLVHNFRVNAGLPSTAVPLGGWEAPDCELRGHFTGHYMSACALMYAATGDEQLKEKGARVVDALAKCQQALGPSGYLSAYPEEFIDRVETGKRVWAPYYTLHKIMAGLFDQYSLCGNKQALDVLVRMASWVKLRTDRLTDEQIQNMLKVEFGGMAEVLANLYGVTSDPVHLALARRFEKRSFLDPLIEHEDKLKGLHVNTHIPQVIGAAREFELTGDRRYFEAASYFWNEVVKARSYATGGTSNYEYWRDEPGRLASQLSQETQENCCTYNMLKLTEHLYAWSADAHFMNYYERALFSGILPTQHPEVGGAIMYFVPLKSGLFKMFGIPDSSYFCCNGSGIESFSKLGNNIYHHNDNELFVDLFVASEVNWIAQDVTIRQETKFPEENRSTIIVSPRKPTAFVLNIRVPSWTTTQFSVAVNGRKLNQSANQFGYVEIRRSWMKGDRVDVYLPMELKLSRLPDDSTVAAILYGPVVLAGALGKEEMTKEMENGLATPEVERMVSLGAALPAPVLVVPASDPNEWIKPVEGKALTFQTVSVGKPHDVTLIPFYKLFGQRYAVYWNVYSPEEFTALQALHPALPSGVIDRVVIGDQRSELEHNFQAWRFQTGERNGKKWVKSPLSFRYDLNVDPEKSNTLACTYWGGEKDCTFDILIDGKRMTSETLAGGNDNEFVQMKYQIPLELSRGKDRVAVTFRAKSGKPTGEVYDCEIKRTAD